MLQTLRRVDFIPACSPEMPDCFISIAGANAPTLVAIHGISRNAAEMATRFSSHPAFANVNIVAPLFERNRFGKYQQLLARREHQTSADRALFALLDELRREYGIPAEKFLLFGFSGGAQMAHRLTMLHPHRVSRLCAAAAGWYLLPDPELAYPYGLGEGCPDMSPAGDFRDVPTTVIVGNRDTHVDASVRQDPVIVERQGTNRLRRARIWVREMAEHSKAGGKSPNVSLTTLVDGSHDFGISSREAGLLDHAASALIH